MGQIQSPNPISAAQISLSRNSGRQTECQLNFSIAPSCETFNQNGVTHRQELYSASINTSKFYWLIISIRVDIAESIFTPRLRHRCIMPLIVACPFLIIL